MTKTSEERKVNLTPQFSEILYYYLEGGNRLEYPVYQTWQANLIRWASQAGIKDSINISGALYGRPGKAGYWSHPHGRWT